MLIGKYDKHLFILHHDVIDLTKNLKLNNKKKYSL